jgi:hypothetical protein
LNHGRKTEKPQASEKGALLMREVRGARHASGLFFPSEVGEFSLREARALAEGTADDSTVVRYDYRSGPLYDYRSMPLMDIYIYSQGKVRLPEGIEARVVSNELEVASGNFVKALQGSGKASIIETISTDVVEAGRREFIRRVCRVNARNGPVQASLLYLTISGQHFVKVWSTCLEFHQEAIKRAVEQCLAALSLECSK